jgi:lysophospholipase L1-like esterase
VRPSLKPLLLGRAFDPARLASARAWYEADRIAGFSAGTGLQTWTDATSLGNSATQATSGNRPTMQAQGGLPVARFDGVNDSLAIPSAVSMQVQNLTMFAVVYPTKRHVPATESYLCFGPLAGVSHMLYDRLSNYGYYNSGLVFFANGPAAGDPGAYVVSNYVGKVNGADKIVPAVLMVQTAPSTTLFRANGLNYSAAVLSAVSYSGGGLGIFNNATWFTGDMYAAALFESVPDADRDRVYNWLLAKYGYTYTAQNLIVTLGDSLSQGVNSTTQLNEYPSQLIGLLNADGKPYQLYNDARSGARISHVSGRLATYVTPKYMARTHNIAVLWIGSNDIQAGVAGSTVYTDLTAVISSLKATGWTVAVVTMLPRTDVSGTKETERGNFNTAIVGNAAGADYVVNLGTVVNLQTTSNTTYYAADATHLTDVGYGLVAQAVHDALGSGA